MERKEIRKEKEKLVIIRSKSINKHNSNINRSVNKSNSNVSNNVIKQNGDINKGISIIGGENMLMCYNNGSKGSKIANRGICGENSIYNRNNNNNAVINKLLHKYIYKYALVNMREKK